MYTLKVKRLQQEARLPKRAKTGDAGMDLFATEDATIPPKGQKLIPTGIAFRCPDGTYGRIAEKSGLAYKHAIGIGGGVIDQEYDGEVKVILRNFGDQAYEVKKGDKIAQLVLEQIAYAEVQEVEELEKTERGSAGFGSTGK